MKLKNKISKEIITKDDSITYYNEEFQETYHSTTGAKEEAIKKFANFVPINSSNNNMNNPIRILDICFGIGYNSAAALDKNKNCEIIALENDINIIKKIPSLKTDFKFYDEIKKAVNNESNKIKIIIDDARISVKNLINKFNNTSNKLDSKDQNKKFDVVFLDPFSPKKCPELWTKEFLRDIKQLMKQDAILCTYSCASKFRKNLKELGFVVKDGPCVGRRSPSTVAYNK